MIPSKPIFHNLVAKTLGVTALLTFSGLLSAAPITGGVTTVALDASTLATLQSLFTIGTVSPTTLVSDATGQTVASFPITGGDTSTGIINHSGGLTLTGANTPSGVGTQVWTANYVIDLNSSVLTSQVSVNGGAVMNNVPLFDIGAGNVLTVDSALAGDLTALFGLPDLTGNTIGVATVSPTTGAVPEPASLALGAAGLLAALAFTRKKKQLQ